MMRLFPNPCRAKKRLLKEFKNGRILDLSRGPHCPKNEETESEMQGVDYDLKVFPWPVSDNSYDLVLCQHVLEHLPDTAKTLEEFNRIIAPGGKIYIETPHYTWFDAHRHQKNCHRYSFSSFDYFVKGNAHYKTDFHIDDKYLFFDDLTYLLGIGFLANICPRLYEKRLSFIFPANSFHVTFQVHK
jgi:SAM-dependent methyltransferase